MRREPVIDHCALYIGQENPRDRGDRRVFARVAGTDELAVQKRARAAVRMAETAREAVINPARLAFAAACLRDYDSERRLTMGKIVRTVDRIDDPAILRQFAEQRWIGMRGLLANHRQRGIDLCQAFCQKLFGLMIGNGNEIVGSFLVNLV